MKALIDVERLAEDVWTRLQWVDFNKDDFKEWVLDAAAEQVAEDVGRTTSATPTTERKP